MKPALPREIAQTINRQTHLLSTAAFLPIRQKLESRVRDSLKQGKTVETVLEELRNVSLDKLGFR
jgi:hypothetical protein